MAYKDSLWQTVGLSGYSEIIPVDLSNQALKLDSAEDARPVVEKITECAGMTLLRLSGNTVGVEASKSIAEALESKPSLQFAIFDDMYTGRLRSEVPPSLNCLGGGIIRSDSRLLVLDLSDNAFGPDGVRACLDLLTSPAAFSLKILKLNNNGLGIGGGKLLAEALIGCHRNAQAAGEAFSLMVFISGRNRLENEGAMALSEAFTTIGTLKFISMPQNGIRAEGISALANAVTCNKELKHLDLSDNTFSESGAHAMAKAVAVAENLDVINFGDCLISSPGIRAISAALKGSHAKLKELYLTYNEIDREAAVDLIQSLTGKSELSLLHLNGNQFGEAGIKEIQEAVEQIGLSPDVLDSMSDDEGDSDDEEKEDDEDDNDNEGEKKDSGVSEGETSIHRNHDKKETGTTVSEFLENPSVVSLLSLGPDRVRDLRGALGEVLTDPRRAVSAFCTVSSVVVKGSEVSDVCETVNELADAILEPCFTSKPDALVSEILYHLGLLKSEDKLEPVHNRFGPLVALEHVVNQTYCPKSAVTTLAAFVSRPHAALDTDARHRLLQALYNSR